MANIPSLIAANQHRWDVMHIKPSHLADLNAIAARLIAAKDRYVEIEKATNVPWFVVAVIHWRESSENFARQLAQGDPLGKVSTHVPRGEGPYYNHPNDVPLHDAFYRSALVALIDDPPHAAKWKDWTPGGALTLLEEYNGLGYAGMGKASPYNWSGSDQYSRGKYDSDGHYNQNIVDAQEGCAPIIAAMMAIDPTIKFSGTPA